MHVPFNFGKLNFEQGRTIVWNRASKTKNYIICYNLLPLFCYNVCRLVTKCCTLMSYCTPVRNLNVTNLGAIGSFSSAGGSMHCRMLLMILETWFLGHLKIIEKLYQKNSNLVTWSAVKFAWIINRILLSARFVSQDAIGIAFRRLFSPTFGQFWHRTFLNYRTW